MTGLVGLKGRTRHGFRVNAPLFLLWGTSFISYLLKHKEATLSSTVPWSPGITTWVNKSQISGSRFSFVSTLLALSLSQGSLADTRDLPKSMESSLGSQAVLLPECLSHEGVWERLRFRPEDHLGWKGVCFLKPHCGNHSHT